MLTIVHLGEDDHLPLPDALFNRIVMYHLPNGLRVGMAVVPFKQQDPDQNDELLAHGRIYLPSEGMYIHPELRFGQRVTLAGESMLAPWGTCTGLDMECASGGSKHPDKGWRMGRITIRGDTWDDAMYGAAEDVIAQVRELIAAIQKRMAAYQSEGFKYVTELEMLRHASSK